MNEKIQNILTEIESVIVGKNENVEKILMAILAQGHVLMEDVPGVGKTTTALTFAKVLGLDTAAFSLPRTPFPRTSSATRCTINRRIPSSTSPARS